MKKLLESVLLLVGGVSLVGCIFVVPAEEPPKNAVIDEVVPSSFLANMSVGPEGPWYVWMQKRTRCSHQQIDPRGLCGRAYIFLMKEEPPVCDEGCHDELEALKTQSRWDKKVK